MSTSNLFYILVRACAAFKLLYNQVQRDKGNQTQPSAAHKHKTYVRLEDAVQRLRYANERAELRNEWNANADQIDDGALFLTVISFTKVTVFTNNFLIMNLMLL